MELSRSFAAGPRPLLDRRSCAKDSGRARRIGPKPKLRRAKSVLTAEEGGGVGTSHAATSWKQFVPSQKSHQRVRRATIAAMVLVVLYLATFLYLRSRRSGELPVNLLFCAAGEEGGLSLGLTILLCAATGSWRLPLESHETSDKGSAS